MVTQKERVFLTIKEAEQIINESNGKKEMVNRLRSLTKRQKAPPPPKGSISIREASRKYGIPDPTIGRWVKDGFIPKILTTKNYVYIDESKLAEIIEKYKSLPKGTRKSIKSAVKVMGQDIRDERKN